MLLLVSYTEYTYVIRAQVNINVLLVLVFPPETIYGMGGDIFK